MTPIYDKVTTIAGAMQAGATREVSNLYGAYTRRKDSGGGHPPWQVVERYLRLEFPELDRRQIRRVRELSQEAIAAGRAAQRGDASSRAFQGLAPGTSSLVGAVAFVPLYRINPRTGERVKAYSYPVSVIISRTATVGDVRQEIFAALPPASTMDADDSLLAGSGHDAGQEWGEPTYGYFQRF